MVERLRLGVTKNSAPASMQARAEDDLVAELVGYLFKGANRARNRHRDLCRAHAAAIVLLC